MSLPKIIAHRGASGHAPENSLAAIAKAAELGAKCVEFDCMLAGDGTIMIHHDESLRRITGAELMVSEATVSKIKALDAGSWFGPEFCHEKVPTFLETMDMLVALGIGANIEIKPATGQDVATGRAIAEQVEKRWPRHLPAPVISSFSEDALKACHEMIPQIEHALLWEEIPSDWEDRLHAVGATSVHVDGDHLTRAQFNALRDAGFPVRVYTVNDAERGRELLEWGVESLITDFPDRF